MWTQKPTVQVTLITDGSSWPNDGNGPGGWAAVLINAPYGVAMKTDVAGKVLTGNAYPTTNNRMELTAVLEGLKALKVPCHVTVVTDSDLVIRWLEGKYQANQPEIKALVVAILSLCMKKNHVLEFHQVKGHSGHYWNEMCDMLAAQARAEVKVN